MAALSFARANSASRSAMARIARRSGSASAARRSLSAHSTRRSSASMSISSASSACRSALTAVGSMNTVFPLAEVSIARPGNALWKCFCTGRTYTPPRWVT